MKGYLERGFSLRLADNELNEEGKHVVRLILDEDVHVDRLSVRDALCIEYLVCWVVVSRD